MLYLPLHLTIYHVLELLLGSTKWKGWMVRFEKIPNWLLRVLELENERLWNFP